LSADPENVNVYTHGIEEEKSFFSCSNSPADRTRKKSKAELHRELRKQISRSETRLAKQRKKLRVRDFKEYFKIFAVDSERMIFIFRNWINFYKNLEVLMR
jgi:predicted ribosome-associated RNA-binding protein Tma20